MNRSKAGGRTPGQSKCVRLKTKSRSTDSSLSPSSSPSPHPIGCPEYLSETIPLIVTGTKGALSHPRILRRLPRSYFLAHSTHYDLHYTRRGHLRSATVKISTNPRLSVLSHNGESFMQGLESGPVWALKGVIGSGKGA